MRRVAFAIVLMALGGGLEAHVQTYRLDSSGFNFQSSDVAILPSGDVLSYVYDSLGNRNVFLKTSPMADWAVGYYFPALGSFGIPYVGLKVEGTLLVAASVEGVIFSDTNLAGGLIVLVGGKANAQILSGDTVVLIWGDSLFLTLGRVTSTSFSEIHSLYLGSDYSGSVRYDVLHLGGDNVVAAYPSPGGDSLILTFTSISGGSISYDSSLVFGLPSGWALKEPSTIRLLRIPPEGLAVGFTVHAGTTTHPAILIYDGTSYSAFVMDSTGTLTDIALSPEGLTVTTEEGLFQIVPLSLSDGTPSLKGVRYPLGPLYGGSTYAYGHYVLSGEEDSALTLTYTDLDTSTSFLPGRIASWNSLPLSQSPASITPLTVSTSPLDSSLPSTTFTPSYGSVFATDTLPPFLLSHPTDTLIRAYDTLAFGFSEPLDPMTFQDGVEVEAYGSLKYPVSHASYCTGTWCYLIVNASGADSITVRLTGLITDTGGVPLTPASRISLNFKIMPTRPYVVFTQPDSGEINVPLNANIGVWFSNPMNATTINTYTVDITDGTVSYPFTVFCPFPNMCVLDPVGDFPPGANITVSFTDGVRDTFDQPLMPKVVSFRTVEEDTLSPKVAMTVPDSGDIGVPRNFSVSVLFTKPMDTTTVAGGVSLLGSSSGSHTFNVFCPTLKNCVIRPLSAFLPNEVVTLRFNSSIRDTFNRALVPKTVIFQVGTAFDNVPPNVSIVAPPNDTLELYHPITSPVKAAVWDNSGILMASWMVGTDVRHAPLSCRGLPYVASDTTCVDISELPSGTYALKAIAYDLANTQAVDTVLLIVHDTVRPRVSFTEPADGDLAVSPYTDVSITFTEPMDTTVFSPAIRVVVGSSPITYTYRWNTPYTLRLSFSEALPWDSTVKVVLDSLQDLSGNRMVPDSFSFRIVGETQVGVVWLNMRPETVFVGNMDSVRAVAVATSDHPILRAVLLIGDRDSVDMEALDGNFDEPVETLTVWLKTDELPAGNYPVKVKAYNPYVFGLSIPKYLNVMDVPLLSPENVYVYPSPVKDHGKIRVIVGEPTTLTVEVFDLKYRRILYDRRSFGSASVYERELPDLPVGVYLLRVRAGDMTVSKWFAVVGRR